MRLVRHDDATLREKILDHPQAQGKTEIQPDGVRNHVGWETVAAIEACVSHTPMFHLNRASALTLRCRPVITQLSHPVVHTADPIHVVARK